MSALQKLSIANQASHDDPVDDSHQIGEVPSGDPSLAELREENDALRKQIYLLQRAQIDHRLENDRLQKQLQEFRFGRDNDSENITHRTTTTTTHNENKSKEALKEIVRLTKSLEKSEIEREILVSKIRGLIAENQKLVSAQNTDRKEIMYLQDKLETCDQEVRQLLRLERQFEEHEETIVQLRAQLRGDDQSVTREKRKASDALPQGERAAKKIATESAQRKKGASKSLPEPDRKRPIQYRSDFSSSDDESDDDDMDDIYLPSKDSRLDDQEVWGQRREARKTKERKQGPSVAGKSRPQRTISRPAHPEVTRPAPVGSSTSQTVSYPCPVKGCTFVLKFEADHHPPLKNGLVSDAEAWEGDLAIQMREHMEGNHPTHTKDQWPKGFQPITQERQIKVPAKEPDVIDLLSDSD